MQTMREDAETILREAVAAAQPGRLVREALAAERLTGRIVLLAAGKAAWAMAQAACACVPVRRGIVITKDGHLGGALPPLELAEAGHPVPDARAFAAARRALALTQGLTAEDTVLVLLSGGASALFELPLVPEARLREITQRLLRSGADIAAMNYEYVGYAIPNTAAIELLGAEEYNASPVNNPPQEVLDKCKVFEYLGDDTKLYDQIWTEIISEF